MLAVSLLLKIPLFLAFLVFFVLWIAAAFLALLRLVTGLQSRSAADFLFTRALPLDLVGALGIVGILGVTALFFDLGLFALLLLGAGIGYVLGFIAWEVMTPLEEPFGSHVVWSFARLALNDRLQKANNVVGLVLVLGLIGAISWAFFTRAIPSPEATRLIFQVFLVYLSVSFVLTVLPQRVIQIASRNMHEDVRTRMLLLQFGGLFGLALYVSLLAWSFDLGTGGSGLPGSGVGVSFSFSIILIIVGIFVATSLVPYLLGWRRARWWRRRLLERRRADVDRMIAILKAPGETDYGAELTGLQNALGAEYRELVERDPLLERALAWDDVESIDGVDPKEQLIFTAYRDVREGDPRIQHMNFLHELSGHASAIEDELASYKRKDYRRRKAESHIGFFEDQRAKIDSTLREEGSGRNWVLAASSVLVLPIMGGVLSKVGERVWEIIDTAPQ